MGNHRNWALQLDWRGPTAAFALIGALLLAAFGTEPAQAQTYNVLYTFTGGTDGAFPAAALIRDAAGNLYGTTEENNPYLCTALCGNVFKIDPGGKESTLHTFTDGKDGSGPSAGVVRDQAGNLYGTTQNGGSGAGSLGVVFKLSPTGKETILHYFPKKPGDGEAPEGGVILDSAGSLYGTTIQGGGGGCNFGCGTIFKIDAADKETITSPFNGTVWAPTNLVRDAAGNFYGTTGLGGGTGCGGVGCGTVYKVDKAGKLTLLYAFHGAPDGNEPNGPVVFDKAGNLYGVTWEGGNTGPCPPSGCGTVYKIDKTGKETVLHKFSLGDGFLPYGALVLDSKGNLYGTTFAGGASCPVSGCGTVYKLDKKGKETVLYSFTGQTDGGFPLAGLVRDEAGNLYGTAYNGGYTRTGLCFPSGCGVVFKLTP